MADSVPVSAWGVMYRYRLLDGGYAESLIQHAWWMTREDARAFIAKWRPRFEVGESMRVVRLKGVLSPC